MRYLHSAWLVLLPALALQAPSAHGASVPGSCRTTLSINDARLLALSIPNARAFAENHGATLAAEPVHAASAGTVSFRVTATAADKPTEVGVYTVNLRTGVVLDDDQEPAGDDATSALWQQMQHRHCPAR